MNVIEQELKLLLDSEGFECILQKQCSMKMLKQINYYFDTQNHDLHNSGFTLRIREENEDIILCIKSKINKSLFITSQEFEEKVSRETLEKCIKNPGFILKLFPNSIQKLLGSKIKKENLKYLGFIKNNRYCINLIENFTFELDHSIFPNGAQTYELEVEGVSTQEDCMFIMNTLKDIHVNFLLNNKSKYERFLEAINII